jgi:DUF4097 and DUF4098 domain-containing protein YvlB
MRRGSLFAPLLLIGLGGLFLAHNLYPQLPLLDYLARYWPFLLILWGGLRVAEILFWAATKRPLPRTGITPGEWGLVVMLCFVGLTLQAVRGVSTWFPRSRLELGGLDMFGESYDYPLSAEKASSATPRVVIESFRGNAHITGTAMNLVKVTGRKTVRSMDQSGADRANQETPLEISGDGNQIVIHTNQDRASGPQRVSGELEIAVPQGASIEAHGRSGDFDVSGINGTVDISSDRAGVRLDNIGGDARLDLKASDIVRALNLKGGLDLKGRGNDIDLENIAGQVTINGSYLGMIEFHNLSQAVHYKGPQTEFSAEKIPGQVRMPLGNFNGSGLVGPAHLDSRSRDVQVSDFTNALEVSVDRGDIELRPGTTPLGKIDARSRISGNITLALPRDVPFNLTATTARGEIDNTFGGSMQIEESGRGATLHGNNGSGGGPSITVRTNRGEITVRKAAAGEPPLQPSGRPFPGAPRPLRRLKGTLPPPVQQ